MGLVAAHNVAAPLPRWHRISKIHTDSNLIQFVEEQVRKQIAEYLVFSNVETKDKILEAIADVDTRVTFDRSAVYIGLNKEEKITLRDAELVKYVQDISKNALGMDTDSEIESYLKISKKGGHLGCWIVVTLQLVTITVGYWVYTNIDEWIDGILHQKQIKQYVEEKKEVLVEVEEEVCEPEE